MERYGSSVGPYRPVLKPLGFRIFLSGEDKPPTDSILSSIRVTVRHHRLTSWQLDWTPPGSTEHREETRRAAFPPTTVAIATTTTIGIITTTTTITTVRNTTRTSRITRERVYTGKKPERR